MVQLTNRRERLLSLIVFKFSEGSIQWHIMVGTVVLAKWSHLEVKQRKKKQSFLRWAHTTFLFVWIEKVLFRMNINYSKKVHSRTRNLHMFQNQAEKEFILYDKIGRLLFWWRPTYLGKIPEKWQERFSQGLTNSQETLLRKPVHFVTLVSLLGHCSYLKTWQAPACRRKWQSWRLVEAKGEEGQLGLSDQSRCA